MDDYIKIYLDNIPDKSLVLNGVFTDLLKRVQTDNNTSVMLIGIDSDIKAEIAREQGISVTRVNHRIGELVKKSYIKRIKKQRYMLNPFYFATADVDDIEDFRDRYGVATVGDQAAIEKIVRKSEPLGGSMSVDECCMLCGLLKKDFWQLVLKLQQTPV